MSRAPIAGCITNMGRVLQSLSFSGAEGAEPVEDYMISREQGKDFLKGAGSFLMQEVKSGAGGLIHKGVTTAKIGATAVRVGAKTLIHAGALSTSGLQHTHEKLLKAEASLDKSVVEGEAIQLETFDATVVAVTGLAQAGKNAALRIKDRVMNAISGEKLLTVEERVGVIRKPVTAK